jgi:hypothetical protein
VVRINRITRSLQPLPAIDTRERGPEAPEPAVSEESQRRGSDEEKEREEKQKEKERASGPQRRAERMIETTARKAGLGPAAAHRSPESRVLATARKAGFAPSELAELRSILQNLPLAQKREEIRFLETAVFRDLAHPPAAARAFLALHGIRRSRPARLPPEIVHALTRAVQESLLDTEQARLAARTLTNISQDEYDRLQAMLDRAAAPQKHRVIFKELATGSLDSPDAPATERLRRAMGFPTPQPHDKKRADFTEAECEEMLEVKPRRYLRDDKAQESYFARAMALRLEQEGITRTEVQSILQRLLPMVEENWQELRSDPDRQISREATILLAEIAETTGSLALYELFDAASTFVHSWRSFAALLLHLDQIAGSLA